MSELYTGYVVETDDKNNRLKVWIPTKSGAYVFGEYRGVGKNLGNCIGASELPNLSSSAEWCYKMQPLDGGGDTYYNEETGAATVQEAKGSGDKVVDLRMFDGAVGNDKYVAGYNRSFQTPQANPCYNGVSGYNLETVEGITSPYLMNAPEGDFSSTRIGTRVVVAFVNNNSFGIVLGRLPWTEECKSVLAAIYKQKD